jgi:hypothetical protein
MMSEETPKKKRRGRPPVPPSQRASVIVSTRVPREMAEWLAGEYGGGKLTAGVKRAIATEFKAWKKSQQ